MAERTIVENVKGYLANLKKAGIDPRFAVLFGSNATGRADEWSDIDLLVVSPRFDSSAPRELVNILWRVAARTDPRIEPIPCGEKQWRDDEETPILEIARREGIIIESTPPVSREMNS